MTDNTALIPLTQGKVAIVDATDFEWLSQWKWYALCNNNIWRAYRQTRVSVGKQKVMPMHRQIMLAPDGKAVDHVNHDGLDNRRANLRVCSIAENNMNRRSVRGATSKYLGVCAERTKWRARIRHHGKLFSIGLFTDEVEAALAYDAEARKLFGEFANPNFSDSFGQFKRGTL